MVRAAPSRAAFFLQQRVSGENLGSVKATNTVSAVSRVITIMAFCLLGMTTLNANVDSITVAVASNFRAAMQDIVERFEVDTGQTVRVSFGSTGKLHAQISNGAPFDVLLAADAQRPRKLEESGHSIAGTRFTYAIGRLVLWSRDPALAGTDCRSHLERLGADRLAIANPETAPYGAAAREYLIGAGLWKRVQPQLVVGENIAQTIQFVASGNASLGFIAQTQALDSRLPAATCTWPVPEDLHQAIEQQAILLQRAADNSVAAEFLKFLRSAAARTIVARHGYALPE